MIKAKHSKWARLVFNPYINRQLRKSFSNFYLVNSHPVIPINNSILITPNHISWWDGFFIDYVIRKKSDRLINLMLLEKSLKRYWFFRKLGAYSIEPERPRSIVNTIRYTNELLQNSNNIVVTYPQGEIEPFEKRPLEIKEGIKLFVKNSSEKVTILPVGFKIQYYNEKNPAVYCRFGELLSADEVINNFEVFRQTFTDNLDKLGVAAFNRNHVEDLFK